MKKLASTFPSMFLVLGGVSILAAAALASVQKLTEEPIRKAALVAQENAIKAVVPAFDNSPVEERYWLPTPDGDSLACFHATKDGHLQGVAIESYSRNGYGGLIKVMVGLEPDGRLHGFSVLAHTETPGLGSKMEAWFKTNKPGQYLPGLHPGKTKLRVRKDGGDVDAITAATITSRAFLEAIDRAFQAYVKSGIDAVTPSTTAMTPQKVVDKHHAAIHKAETDTNKAETDTNKTETDGVSGATQTH
jgi:electron transport complex protein RnfG